MVLEGENEICDHTTNEDNFDNPPSTPKTRRRQSSVRKVYDRVQKYLGHSLDSGMNDSKVLILKR